VAHYDPEREEANNKTYSTTHRLGKELKARRKMGIKKYGTSLGSAGLTRKQLLQHAKEEALDLAEYLQTLIDMEKQI
jgi:hypothetical protein